MKNIAVVLGGFSSEYDVSIKSGKFILDNLKDNPDWNVYEVCISKTKNTVNLNNLLFELDYENFLFKSEGKIIKPDAVFNIIHGSPGENGDLAKILERNNIPQTGCSSYISDLTFNKKKYIDFVSKLEIPSSKQLLLSDNKSYDITKIIDKINIPCIVKPNKGGSSIGVSKVNNMDELQIKIKNAFKESDEVLVESFLSGQEVSVGVIQKKANRIILPITEIISENEVFDYAAKYEGQSKEITPGNISIRSKELIYNYINTIYDNMDIRGITRSEFIIVDEIPHILETNTIPGFTKQSIIPQQIKSYGLSVNEVINDQINLIL
tara:strand:+ start:31 stop:999 length:969 start_codon:yes stop_codon:yes gene_type:complete